MALFSCSHMIIFSWNHYRPHTGLGGGMVIPYPLDADGKVQEISFLGGLPHTYRRRRIRKAA